jgi:hypothetical protein
MKQTPITKAIDIVLSMTEINESSLATPTNKALSRVYMTLQSLLPYERECIEGAYNSGYYKGTDREEFKDDNYFTNTYNNPQGGGV